MRYVVALVLLLHTAPAPAQHSVGNAGNPFDLMMHLSCERAAHMVLQYQQDGLVDPMLNEWIESNRRLLALDVLGCDLRFTNADTPIDHPLAESDCALTNVSPIDYPQGEGDLNTIYLSRPSCIAQQLDEAAAVKLLIHEAVHHFQDATRSNRDDDRIEDEQFCDDVAAAIYQMWQRTLQDEPRTWRTEPTLIEAPERRAQHTAVWTAETPNATTSERMVIWGGCSPTSDSLFECGQYFADGGIFDPKHNTWSDTPTDGAPEERSLHTAVWTGETGDPDSAHQMIVWGGCNGGDACGTSLQSGGTLDLASNPTWRATSVDLQTPEPRVFHSAVWADDRMVVWGGVKGFKNPDIELKALDTGSVYFPEADGPGRWQVMTPHEDQPSPRMDHTAVWTGHQMIVWGGCDPEGIQYMFCRTLKGDGARYDVDRNIWLPMSDVNAPSPRRYHSAVWTGRYMIVWGGQNRAEFVKTGALYDPEEDKWYPMSHIAPTGRSRHVAVWTGAKMIVWGGSFMYRGEHQYPVDFGEYHPDEILTGRDHWNVLDLNAHPDVAKDLTAVWTEESMIVWGGNNYHDVYFDRGGTYVTPRWD